MVRPRADAPGLVGKAGRHGAAGRGWRESELWVLVDPGRPRRHPGRLRKPPEDSRRLPKHPKGGSIQEGSGSILKGAPESFETGSGDSIGKALKALE
jgi:hypothetical protein